MTPRGEDQHAAREARLDELHDKLTTAVDQVVSGEDWKRALAFAANFRSRSFNNTLLIWAQHAAAFERGLVPEPTPSYVAGYKQWQGLGRQVQKGQPGYQIIAPITGRFASANPQDAESWRRLGKFDKPRPGETVRSKMVGVRPAYVWDASQTAGDDIPEPPRPHLLEGEAPAGLWEGLAAQVKAAGFNLLNVTSASEIYGANGVTDYLAHTVTVRADMDAAARVKTLAHELGHVLMHGPDNREARQHRGIGEVEAESVALMVGAAHGMDTTSYTPVRLHLGRPGGGTRACRGCQSHRRARPVGRPEDPRSARHRPGRQRHPTRAGTRHPHPRRPETACCCGPRGTGTAGTGAR